MLTHGIWYTMYIIHIFIGSGLSLPFFTNVFLYFHFSMHCNLIYNRCATIRWKNVMRKNVIHQMCLKLATYNSAVWRRLTQPHTLYQIGKKARKSRIIFDKGESEMRKINFTKANFRSSYIECTMYTARVRNRYNLRNIRLQVHKRTQLEYTGSGKKAAEK